MRVHITGSAVEIDGEGGGVTVAEIERVREAVRGLLGVEPELKMTGLFRGAAVGPGSEQRDTWDLSSGTSAGYVPVINVGTRWLWVLYPTGVNKGHSVAVDPAMGQRVRVRMTLPKK